MTLFKNKRTIKEFEERTGVKSEERIPTGPLLLNEEQVMRTAGGTFEQRLEGNLTKTNHKTREEKPQIHQKDCFYLIPSAKTFSDLPRLETFCQLFKYCKACQQTRVTIEIS